MMSRSRRVHCADCDVWLHDEETLRNHKIGKPHLKRMQRIEDDMARRALSNYNSSHGTGQGYYERPTQYAERLEEWNAKNHENGNHRGQRTSDSDYEDNRRSRSPIRSRFKNDSSSEGEDHRDYKRGRDRERKPYRRMDVERSGTSSSAYPVVPTKPNNEYRAKMEPDIKKVNGQYYCDPCDTYCQRMDVMQAHLSGKNHKKKTKQIARFACDLCLIEVSSEETLQTHYQGMSHIKRAKVAEEAKKEIENPMNLTLNDMEEMADLRQRCQKLERQTANLQQQVDTLLKFKKNCLEKHHGIKSEGVLQ